ncbi:MAG TPA: hypothetical protein VMT54_11785 [Candidatus Cybelea sp.]|nr:hypothetical protein [Candidatus Cybelea sp.]
MTFTVNLLNLIAGLPNLIGRQLVNRLTTILRPGSRHRPRPLPQSRTGQSPPRLDHSFWLARTRINWIRPSDLSPHLRRDIGLDW